MIIQFPVRRPMTNTEMHSISSKFTPAYETRIDFTDEMEPFLAVVDGEERAVWSIAKIDGEWMAISGDFNLEFVSTDLGELLSNIN